MLSRPVMRAGVVAHRLDKNVTFYVNEGDPPAPGRAAALSEDRRPLLLMLPWLGSRPQALTKYCDVYFRRGLDVLVVESEVTDFLWPRWGLERGRSLLELLHSQRFVSRPLLVHAFSIGGYSFAQLLVLLSRDRNKYSELPRRIRGQVYDSLVMGSVEKMASGLGKTSFPRLETLVKHASLCYFRLFQRQTLDYFHQSIDVFRNTPLNAPALFFFCENDVMSDWQAQEELVEYWRERGIDVTAKKWAESTHAGHLRRHPEEYLNTLNMFLHPLLNGNLKARM